MDIVLAPHNDDEALFGAYTCLRYRPKVIVVLRSFVEAGWNPPVHYAAREAESASSCHILGCEYEQWTHPDNRPDWEQVRAAMETLDPERVWAPLPEDGGHPHHNAIGALARELWPQTVFYATYTHRHGKTTTGTLVEPEPGWEKIKREAMRCYVSQATHPQCAVAFNGWAIDEYVTEPALVAA
jgi:LmbE family N-acetylglucosaminyl deacetylase